MPILPSIRPVPDPNLPWVDPRTGQPLPPFAEWGQYVARIAGLLNVGQIGPLIDAADDAAAATAGVPVNGLYRTGSAVQIRLA